jgi:hypothetical protein
MRAFIPVLMMAAACGADNKPEPPATPEPAGEATPAIPEPPPASGAPVPSPPAAAGTPAPAAAGAQQYVGLRSPDLLLEVPEPLRPRGERVLDEDSKLGLVAVGLEGGNELIFLDRRTDEGDFVVEAVLEMPAGVTAEQVAWEHCEAGGKLDPRVVGVVPTGAACSGPGAAATLAWRVDRDAKRFDSIAPDDIRCRPPMCPDPIGNDLQGVPGGVEGGVEGGVPGGIIGGD